MHTQKKTHTRTQWSESTTSANSGLSLLIDGTIKQIVVVTECGCMHGLRLLASWCTSNIYFETELFKDAFFFLFFFFCGCSFSKRGVVNTLKLETDRSPVTRRTLPNYSCGSRKPSLQKKKKRLLLGTHPSSRLMLNEDLWASKNSFAINQKCVVCVCVCVCVCVQWGFWCLIKSHYLKLRTCEIDLWADNVRHCLHLFKLVGAV